MVRDLLARFKWRQHLANADVLKQAAVLAQAPVVQPKEAQQRQIPYRQRLTYAEEQAKWEWEHNKRAREAYDREKQGFL